MNNRPIGVFDSGIGGLTVYQAIKKMMPQENVIYLGDTARLPYGNKSPEAIIRFSEENALFLINKNVKIIVIACNSSSSYAVYHLQQVFATPVIGVIEPGAQKAVELTKGKIGIIGTTATIKSKAYEKSILAKNNRIQIISRDCPLFVPLVEEGWLDHPVTQMVVAEYLLPLKQSDIDSLVLGCTHYPVLKKVIGHVLGDDIILIDSAQAVAFQVYSILKERKWLCLAHREVHDEFYVTDSPDRFKKVGEIFLGKKIKDVAAITI